MNYEKGLYTRAGMTALTVLAVLAMATATSAQNIIWVSRGASGDFDLDPDDLAWVELLEADGYTVNYEADPYWRDLDATKIQQLEDADLVIMSRGCNSGDHDDGTEPADWNAISTPIIVGAATVSRSTRWQWFDDASNPDSTENHGVALMEVLQTNHPIFKGITLDADNNIDVLIPGIGDSLHIDWGMNFLATTDVGNGSLIAKVDDDTASPPDPNLIWIAEWTNTGTPYYTGSGYTPGGHRLYLLFGSGHDTGFADGSLNFNAAGIQLFLNAVRYMIGGGTKANAPSPVNGTDLVSVDTILTWEDPQEPNDEDVTYNVYFGTDPNCDENPLVIADEDVNQYDPPGDLALNTTYYWQVDVIDPNGGGTPIIVQGSCWSFTTVAMTVDLDVSKVMVKAGKDRDNPEDMIIAQGDLDVEEDAYNSATSILVRIGTSDEVEYQRTIPAPASEEELPELKNGNVKFKGVGDPDANTGQFQLQLKFNRNGRTGKYKIIGKKIDLSGLEATGSNPMVVELLFGGFNGVAELIDDANDVVVNSKQSLPMCLLSGLKDKVGVDKVIAKPDQVKINKGQISALDPNLDISAVDVTVVWDLFEETIPADDPNQPGFVNKGNGRFDYKKPRGASDDLKITKLQIDLNKCTLKLQIKDGENLTSTGSAIFGLQAGDGGDAFDASIVVDLPD